MILHDFRLIFRSLLSCRLNFGLIWNYFESCWVYYSRICEIYRAWVRGSLTFRRDRSFFIDRKVSKRLDPRHILSPAQPSIKTRNRIRCSLSRVFNHVLSGQDVLTSGIFYRGDERKKEVVTNAYPNLARSFFGRLSRDRISSTDQPRKL